MESWLVPLTNSTICPQNNDFLNDHAMELFGEEYTVDDVFEYLDCNTNGEVSNVCYQDIYHSRKSYFPMVLCKTYWSLRTPRILP